MLVSPMRDDIAYTPVGSGLVTSNAGFRRHPVTGRRSFHSGVDLKARLNEKVYNLLDGIVTKVGWRGNLGVAVEIYHPYPNILTISGHLNAYTVANRRRTRSNLHAEPCRRECGDRLNNQLVVFPRNGDRPIFYGTILSPGHRDLTPIANQRC